MRPDRRGAVVVTRNTTTRKLPEPVFLIEDTRLVNSEPAAGASPTSCRRQRFATSRRSSRRGSRSKKVFLPRRSRHHDREARRAARASRPAVDTGDQRIARCDARRRHRERHARSRVQVATPHRHRESDPQDWPGRSSLVDRRERIDRRSAEAASAASGIRAAVSERIIHGNAAVAGVAPQDWLNAAIASHGLHGGDLLSGSAAGSRAAVRRAARPSFRPPRRGIGTALGSVPNAKSVVPGLDFDTKLRIAPTTRAASSKLLEFILSGTRNAPASVPAPVSTRPRHQSQSQAGRGFRPLDRQSRADTAPAHRSATAAGRRDRRHDRRYRARLRELTEPRPDAQERPPGRQPLGHLLVPVRHGIQTESRSLGEGPSTSASMRSSRR